ncbi:type IV toxin-antitoxin system AbiEi family antitoxin domain-containing protein [Nonomuraea cypriaca]|uniref:type IV toxin-antitoxin system AbiEi family antitoxin domain-containing protein n=1 Tax=Nonomuraea cypriaca TaxID=1187855 RepID=UPI0038B2761B
MPIERHLWPQNARRDKLWELAAGQRGYFTAAQAVQAGYSHQAQHFHVRRGNWLRIERGLYRLREFAMLPGQEHDHLVRWWLWSSRRAIVSHLSALVVHDLGIADPAEIHLTVPQDSGGRMTRSPCTVRRCSPARSRTVRNSR